VDAPVNPSEPLSRGIGLHGFRMAALDLWGERGLRAIAERLPESTRAETLDAIVLPVSWYPVRHTLAWDDAAYDGPCARDDAAFRAFLDRAIDLGFGRMRRFFVRLQSAERLVARAPEMWRYQHTHGTLVVAPKLAEPRGGASRQVGATLTLRDHPFARHPLARRATAEVYRYIAAMTGRTSCRETHGAEGPDVLVVRLSWDE